MLPAEKVELDINDVTLTRMGLGGAPLGYPHTKAADSAVEKIITTAWEEGIRYFDTAPRYGTGLSEQRIGNVLRGMPRDEFTISTKVGFLLEPHQPKRAEQGRVERICDFSRDGVLRSLEESCARLQTDRIDIALIHDPDYSPNDPEGDPSQATGDHFREVMEGAYPALSDLRDQGVVRAIGIGMNQWQMLLKFAHEAQFDCFMLAGRYT